jgi:aspartate ammonia-lyase
MTSSPMSHVSMFQQTNDTSSTLTHIAMNTPISTIKSCDHLPNQTQFIRQNAPIMHILTIFHLKFGV